MLASLTIRDIVLIEKAELHFALGLNVLTGETGAGKSILLDALGLAAGERGQGRTALHAGASQASAVAVFEVHPRHPACSLLGDNELKTEDSGEIILRRTVSADGRSRAFVNDQPVSLQLAREVGSALLEVHGLADDRGLFDSATHRLLLDAFGGHASLSQQVAARFAVLKAAEKRLGDIGRMQAGAKEEIEYLSHAAQELGELAPEVGEEAALASERALLMNAERLAQDVAAATEFVSGDGGAGVNLGSALRRLARLPAEGREAALAAGVALDQALTLVEEGRRELEALLARLEVEPGKLEQTEERLFALRAAARKYNVAPDTLANLHSEFEAKLAMLDNGGALLTAAESEVARARAAYLETARELSAARVKAAKSLEEAVSAELAPLKLVAARFRVALVPLVEEDVSAQGLERVAFEIATVAGAAFGPLQKIASGGELARFALALKVALAEASPPAVLVFDEIDRGVGGAVAAALGERLQRLAKTTQVLLVTHSPQVAARANRHFRISRHKDSTRVHELGEDERIEEIARMLAGAHLTDEARAAARRLIQEASNTGRASKLRARA